MAEEEEKSAFFVLKVLRSSTKDNFRKAFKEDVKLPEILQEVSERFGVPVSGCRLSFWGEEEQSAESEETLSVLETEEDLEAAMRICKTRSPKVLSVLMQEMSEDLADSRDDIVLVEDFGDTTAVKNLAESEALEEERIKEHEEQLRKEVAEKLRQEGEEEERRQQEEEAIRLEQERERLADEEKMRKKAALEEELAKLESEIAVKKEKEEADLRELALRKEREFEELARRLAQAEAEAKERVEREAAAAVKAKLDETERLLAEREAKDMAARQEAERLLEERAQKDLDAKLEAERILAERRLQETVEQLQRERDEAARDAAAKAEQLAELEKMRQTEKEESEKLDQERQDRIAKEQQIEEERLVYVREQERLAREEQEEARKREQLKMDEEKHAADEAKSKIATRRIACRFVSDVTIPDGTVVQQGMMIKKIWRLQNSGSEAWPCGCVLACTDSPRLGLVPNTLVRSLPSVDPNQNCDVDVDFTMEAESGSFRSQWRVQDKWGHPMTDVWADVVANKRPVAAAAPLEIDIGMFRDMGFTLPDNVITSAFEAAKGDIGLTVSILTTELQTRAGSGSTPVPPTTPAPPTPPTPVLAPSAPLAETDRQAALVQQLLSMGFQNDVQTLIRVLTEAKNNLDVAVDILAASSPLPVQTQMPVAAASAAASAAIAATESEALQQLVGMGFSDDAANRAALKEAKGELRVAIMILTS